MTDARTMTESLGGDWFRSYGTAPCPVCQQAGRKEQNALTLADGDNGRLMANCKKSDCAFRDIMVMAGLRGIAYRAPDPATIARRETERRADAQRRAGQAERIWQEAQPIAGTAAETYLRARGITMRLASCAALSRRLLARADRPAISGDGGGGGGRQLCGASHLSAP